MFIEVPLFSETSPALKSSWLPARGETRYWFATFSFFYKQPVYKQLALAWQIAKQLSGLQPPFTEQQQKLQIKEKSSFSFEINVK